MTYNDICFRFYRWVKSIIVPSLKYAQLLYEDTLDQLIRPGTYWLDLGCGSQLLPFWREKHESELIRRAKKIVGLDYDFESLKKHRNIRHKVRGDMINLPFCKSSFDVVTSNMAFEHLKETESAMSEIYRVLKPGGDLIFHTPNIFGYTTIIARIIPDVIKSKLIYFLQGRKEEDVFPAYYKMNSFSSIRSLADATGFKIGAMKSVVSSPQLIMIPPLLIIELLLLRILMIKHAWPARTNIIAILRKPEA